MSRNPRAAGHAEDIGEDGADKARPAHAEVVVIEVQGVTDYRAPEWVVGDYAGLVTRLDQGLVQLTQDVGASLTQLGPVPPPAETPVPAGLLAGRAAFELVEFVVQELQHQYFIAPQRR